MSLPTGNKFAIQKVFTITLFDLSTGACLGQLTDLKNTSFSTDGTVVYAQGGAGNPKIIGFDHSKVANLTCQNAVFDFMALAGAQLGATPVVGTNTNLVYTDIVTVTANAGVTAFTGLGTAGSEILFAYPINTDGSLGIALTQAATPSAGKFMYTAGTKALNFYAGDVTTATVAVFYKATAGASSKTITSSTNLFAKNVKVVADGLVRDTCTGSDYRFQLVFNKAKVSNKFDFALTADGQPAVHNIDFEALKACGSYELYHLLVFDVTETV